MSADDRQEDKLSEASLLYRDQFLGFWSSHPHWLLTASRWLSRSLTSAFFVAYGAVIALWLRTSGVDGLRQFLTPGLILQIAMGLAFLVGFCAFASFQTRFALAIGKRGGYLRHEGESLNWPVIITTLLLGMALPLACLLLPNLPFEVRLLGGLLAFLPLLAIDAFLRTAGEATRFPIGALLVAVVMGLFLLLSFANAEEYLARLPAPLLLFFPGLGEAKGLLFALGALQFLLLFRFAIGTAVWIAVPGRESILGGMRRIIGYLLPTKSNSDRQDDSEHELTQDRVMAAAERLQAAGLCVSPIAAFVSSEGSCEEQDYGAIWRPFFPASSAPSRSQSRLLNEFDQLYRTTTQTSGTEQPVLGTFLVEGVLGSGRTTVLEATALIAAVLQGRPVLLLSSCRTRVKYSIERLNQWSSDKGFDARVQSDDITAIVNSFGVHGQSDSDLILSAWPMICVTLAQDWQELLFENPQGYVISREWAKKLAQHYSVILVDDWFEHPDAIAPALPFLIDQMRLLQSVASVPGVVVVSTKPLGHEGRALLGGRLLASSKGQLNNFRLLPRKLQNLSVAELSVDQRPGPALLSQLNFLLSDLDVQLRLWWPSYLQGDLADMMSSSNAIPGPDQLGVSEIFNDHEVLKQSLGGVDNSAMALIGSQRPVLFISFADDNRLIALTLAPRHATQSATEAADQLPVFVHDDSGFARNYLLTSLRMLSSGDAVPFEYFARLGGGNFRHELRDGENVLVKLFADIAEHNQVGEDQELDGSSDVYCSNMVIMDQVSLSAGFTQYGRLILTNLPRLIRENNRGDLWPHRLIFSEPISRRNPEGLVVWKQFGSTLGYSQLQYLRRLILETASTWQAGALRPLANALEIDALPFDNEYIDFIYPKFNFAFRFDDETKESSTICWMQRLVSESCLGLYDKDDKAVLVAAELRALARWSGEERLASLNFNFSEHASMFFIGASEMLRAGHSDLMIEIAKIDWKANIKYRPFMPALSQALHSGLVARFGSIASYGRVMAFELTGDLRDYAMGVIFVLEPQLYGRTLSESVHYLLKNPDAATQLASNVLLHLRHSESNGATEGGDFWLPSKDRDRPQKRDFNFAYALKNRKLATLNCPHCGHASEEEMSYLQSNDQFKCHLCNKRMHLVPTEKNQFVCPSALVKAWWPADVSKPDGDEIEKIMAVWQLVSDRMKYQRDDAQRESLSDCWYSAKESWRRQAGDCEDHAILLASMLIECGVDCWLVWGDVEPGGSHVWVELVNEGSNRIIEATSKKVLGTLPTYDKAKESYDWAYILNPDYSQRTNGKIVERWQGNQWAPVYDNSAE